MHVCRPTAKDYRLVHTLQAQLLPHVGGKNRAPGARRYPSDMDLNNGNSATAAPVRAYQLNVVALALFVFQIALAAQVLRSPDHHGKSTLSDLERYREHATE
ncbi:hypothetical protein HVA01_32330 [Halovibrio variabilis]|uniref:Uncharacterized protein n=1 Tax=Halovibrio variabilis TaxID=31910 RepID=A0A511USL5_9GAMM|nr:hypothetical protein HVA01_32330 [Halovibrio variabilis]